MQLESNIQTSVILSSVMCIFLEYFNIFLVGKFIINLQARLLFRNDV